MALLLVLAAPLEASHAADCATDPAIVGHRGAAGTSPENTLAGVREARASGAEVVEVDVQLSADGVPFIFHDTTGGRTSDVAEVFPDRAGAPITSFTWAELQQLDAGSYFGMRYAGEPVPHLDDVARTVAGSPLVVNIEIKSPEDSPGVEAVLAEHLQTDPSWQRLIERDQVVVSSFDEQSLSAFHDLMPGVPVLQIGAIPDDATLQRWAGYVDGVVTNYRTLDPADLQRVDALGLDLSLYTINSTEAVSAAAELCVDEIITDFPREMVRLLDGIPAIPQANGIVVSDVEENPAGSDLQPENGEYVELVNTTQRTIDVSGYLLQDAVVNRLVVGEGYAIPPGGSLRVYTGPGTNTADRYYNDLGRNVLNNTGDSVAVFTPEMRLVDLYAY
ncbi:glycerophosphodiester phosphodiesterase family protein [Serinicoccus chungangensis]|uniref:glycerophosphodiester phosphodiesterase family protein n=1 Tax=Serinicoccus chungangensis TaxID=767452 RepID=UPI001EE84549|nr:glycerophosphodiester phosphodiesterase family protein [Serinicoccus chungangensis]